ncbi:gliding motility-associated C-terminal domain-containing protein, partial [Salibacter halophilus]
LAFSLDSFPDISIEPTLGAYCLDDSLFATGSESGSSFSWNTSSTDSFTLVNDTGLYTVQVTSPANCVYTDSLYVDTVGFLNTSVNYASSTLPGCVGAQASVMNTFGVPPFSYNWSNGDTLASTFFDTGMHSVLVTDSVGCSFSDTFFVAPDSLALWVSDTASLCPGDSIFLATTDTTSSFPKSWSVVTPNTTLSDSADTVVIEPILSGSYSVELVYSAGSCLDTLATSFTVDPFPSFSIVPTDSIVCFGDSASVQDLPGYSYSWSNGSQDHFTAISSSGWLSVDITSPAGCLFTDSLFIDSLIEVDITLPADTAICTGDSFTVTIPSGQSLDYLVWSDGDSSYQKVIDSSGLFYVEAQNSCGVFRDSINVGFIERVQSFDIPDTSFCRGGSLEISIQDSNASSFIWGDGFNGSDREIENSGSFSLTALNLCGFETDSFSVRVIDTPFVDINDAYQYCDEVPVEIDLPAQYSYQSMIGVAGNDNIVYSQTGSDRVVVENEFGCESVYQVVIEGCAIEVIIPNVFTPNGDGLNDGFEIKNLDGPDFHLRIYNRWGTLVFDNENFMKSWDGHINGSPASDGTYYYILEVDPAIQTVGNKHTYKGFLELVR